MKSKRLAIFACLVFISSLGTGASATCWGQSAADQNDSSSPTAAQPVKTPKKKQTVRRSGKTLELTFNDLEFEMEKEEKFERSMLTQEIKGFHGEKIRIRGYIRPSFSQTGLKSFVFVRDNKECCFGPGAAIFDCVLVKLNKGSETEYTVRPVVIEGLFSLKEYKGPDGKVWSIYRMHKAEVK